MRVLILTGRFGQGHVSCARAIEQRLGQTMPQAQVEVVDFLAEALRSDALYRAFELLVRRGESVFNRLYNRSESGADKFGVPMQRFCFAALTRILQKHRPDVVISTLPLTTQLAGAYKAAGRGHYTLMVAITDTFPHGDWVSPTADVYLAPADETRQALVALGVPSGNIVVSGMPLGPDFYPDPNLRRGGPRRLLVLGGGLGLLPEDLDFYRQLDALEGVRTTVVCGRNAHLLEKLEGRFQRVEAVGFVSDMPARMRRAHLALGKPGGITLFEAIACRLPLLSVQPFLGPEHHNARFITAHGIGAVLEDEVANSVDTLAALLRDEPRLAAMEAAMEALESTADQSAIETLLRQAVLAEAG